MTAPLSQPNLAQRIAAVQGEIHQVERDGTNPGFKKADGTPHKYASRDALMKAVRPIIAKHGVAALVSCDRQWVEADGLARVEMRLILTDGIDTIEITGQGSGADRFDKAVFKAQTGATRYLLSQAFLIDTGEDAVEESTAGKEVSTRLDTPQPAPQEASSGTASASAADNLLATKREINTSPVVSEHDRAILRSRIGELRQLDPEHPRIKGWDKLGTEKQKKLTPKQAATATKAVQDEINEIKLANPELPVTA